MYSFSYLEPVCFSMSSSTCCFLTCIQVSQEAGQVIWHSHLFQNFPQFILIHTVKGFDIVNKAEMFFWNSLIFPMIQRRGPQGGEMKVGLVIDWRFVRLPLPITSYTFILKIEHGTNVRFTKSSTHSHILAYIQPLFSEPQLCGTSCSSI